MKVYIILSWIANCVGGAPIYHRNKAKYLEERGWKVFVFSGNQGKVLIHGLEKYSDYYFPCLSYQPNSYSCRQRNKLLGEMLQHIDKEACKEIIVESGSDTTAYWGEYLAKALNARHFLFLLDENNKQVSGKFLPFYEFKYNRGELACIHNSVLRNYFEGAFPLRKDEKYELAACCSNSVENYENDFSKSLNCYDYNIGSIGRLEKIFVPTIVQGIEEFANAHPDKRIQAIFIGGTEQKKVYDDIERSLSRHTNIKCVITGYMWPIPQSIFSKIDVFVSGAGSVFVSMMQGVPTIVMDALNSQPLVIANWDEDKNWSTIDAHNACVKDLLESVLINHIMDRKSTTWNPADEWTVFCREFDKHTSFFSSAERAYKYYDIERLPLSSKRKLLKLLHCGFGVSGVDGVHAWYRKLKHLLGIDA